MAGHSNLHRRLSALRSTKIITLSHRHLAVSAESEEPLLNLDRAAIILKRETQPATTSSALPTKSCGPNDTSPVCQRPVSSSNYIAPIVLGIAIPLTVALVILLVLHRRHVRKLRSEDANDRHKSLDFGLGDVSSYRDKRGKQGKKGKAIPEMSLSETEKTLGRSRGMSMDMDAANPYLLPPELQQSRESLHSLSRAMNNGDDKYRPATTFVPNNRAPSREGSTSRGGDDSSSYTASTRFVFGEKEVESNQSLLRHAQRMSRSVPPIQSISVTSASSTPISQDPEQSNKCQVRLTSPAALNESLAPLSSGQDRDSYLSDTSKDSHNAHLRKSNDYLGAFIRNGEPSTVGTQAYEEKQSATSPPLQDQSSDKLPTGGNATPPELSPDAEPLSFEFPDSEDPVPIISVEVPNPESRIHEALLRTGREERGEDQYQQDFDYDVRRLTMGVRPLPPDDPTENPEQRAIRIRSFYKEYFDDAKPGPVYTQQDYETGLEGAGYGHSFHNESIGHLVNRGAPYAQPLARRAMTPPPRGPSSLQGAGGGRYTASSSGGHFVQAGPRAYSSSSGRMPLTKKLPPPAPLQILPTPHLLKDDSIIPIDFAPPSSFRERRAGTPDGTKGGLRPYSPILPAHLPLASSFDDLSVMPSP